MKPASEFLEKIVEELKDSSLIQEYKVFTYDLNSEPLEMEVIRDGKIFRIKVVEIEKIDRSRELIEMVKNIKNGMSKEDIEKLFKLRDEHFLGKPK